MKRTTLFFICLSIAFAACKKATIPYYPVDAGLKSTFVYQPSSYWIYRDSISGQIDSFYVNGVGDANVNGTERIGVNMLLCSVDSIIANDYGANFGFYLEQNNIQLQYTDASGLYNYSYNGIVYPFVNGPNTVAGETVSILNINLFGNNFNNTAKVHFYISEDDYFYINSNVGIVKISFNHAGDIRRVWELQRYNLVK